MKLPAALAVTLAIALTAPLAAVASTTVSLRHTGLGNVLVSGGRTLYLFQADRDGHSHCSGQCAANWPPLIVSGALHAGHGIVAHKLGTTRRAGGARQATYNGHPLYRFSGDSGPGQTNGEGINAFGALWYVVGAAGHAA